MVVAQKEQIIIKVSGGQEEAFKRAQEIASDTFREMMPVRIFSQGNRQMISGVLPVRVLVRILAHQAAERGITANKASLATNRPIIQEHVKTIADYLVDSLNNSSDYIIPPMTLNATTGLQVFIPEASGAFATGYAVLPEEHVLNITDGMHRYKAIEMALSRLNGQDERNKLMSDGIPVMITVESEAEQVHQDFADAGRTRPLPPSLLAVYDVRQPGNRAVHAIIDKVALFSERIDATSSTLSIQSPYLFLVNQIRQFVKSSLANNPVLRDESFVKMSVTFLSSASNFDRWVETRVAFLEVMTELIPEWNKVASLPKPQGPEGTLALEEMKKLRNSMPVSLTAAALNALGLVSCDILTEVGTSSNGNLKGVLSERLAPIAELDWSRENEFWHGNLVQKIDSDGVTKLNIKTQSTPVRAAAKKIMGLVEGHKPMI